MNDEICRHDYTVLRWFLKCSGAIPLSRFHATTRSAVLVDVLLEVKDPAVDLVDYHLDSSLLLLKGREVGRQRATSVVATNRLDGADEATEAAAADHL
jgi:hypothetical protein